MRKVIIRIGLILGISAIVYGMYRYYKDNIKKALQYCYKIINISILKISKDLISLKLFMKIQNKSNFDLKLKGYDLTIYVNNLEVAKIMSDREQIIANNAISELELLINFNPSKIFSINDIANLVAYFLIDKSKIVITIRGNFKAGMNFLVINLPVKFSMTLKDIMTTDNTEIEKQKTVCDI